MLCGSHHKHESLVLRPQEDAFASGTEINWGSKGNKYRGNLRNNVLFFHPEQLVKADTTAVGLL